MLLLPVLLLAETPPPRGVNTWDSFRYWATEKDLLAIAHEMNRSGLGRRGLVPVHEQHGPGARD